MAGIGNIFHGDDGFGPAVVRHLLAPGSEPLAAGVRVVDYGIRGMHLAYDLLDGYDMLVLVDLIPPSGAPGEVSVLGVGAEDLGRSDFDPHGMNPAAVLASLSSLGGELPPTYLVGCQPITTEEGIGLSNRVAAAVPTAAAAVRDLVGPSSPRHQTAPTAETARS